MSVKLSIILPIYNVAPYLSRALDSLLSQTINDIEIICIDDASTDGSVDILEEYSLNNKNIKIIKFHENLGVSAARNAGISNASGKYIGFCDPDDFVDKDFYMKLFNAAERSGCEITLGNVMCYPQGGRPESRKLLLKQVEENKFNLVYNFWAAIYSRKMIIDNNIIFPVGVVSGQDLVFLNRAVAYANAIKTVPDTYYHYLIRTNSSYAQALSTEKIISQLNARRIIQNFMNTSGRFSLTAYITVWNMLFRNIIVTFYERNTNVSTHQIIADAAIEFYWNSKFREHIIAVLDSINISLYPLLESRDSIGLIGWMKDNFQKRHPDIRQIYIFGLSLIKLLTYKPGYVKILLFGKIPIYASKILKIRTISN